jgi:5'-nucleotidase
MRELKDVLVDIDGVCIDMLPELLKYYNSEYDDNVQVADITDWGITNFIKPECGEKIYKWFYDPILYEQALPIPGALDGIEKLKSMGCRVVYVTSGVNTGKIDCMKRHGFLDPKRFSDPDLIIAHDKSFIHGDFMVDDYIKNLKSNNHTAYRILFTQLHNIEVEWPLPYRANGWNEVVEIVRIGKQRGVLRESY